MFIRVDPMMGWLAEARQQQQAAEALQTGARIAAGAGGALFKDASLLARV